MKSKESYVRRVYATEDDIFYLTSLQLDKVLEMKNRREKKKNEISICKNKN